MTIEQIKQKVNSPEYEFLKTDPNLGNKIVLLCVAGSHAYGTNTDTSDLDIRGIALNTKRNILIGKDFEQVEDVNTDTVVYSFDKIIKLFCNCNPNTIELLGVNQEHYLHISPIGQSILNNKEIFLTKRAAQSFGGYVNSQFRRLENKSARLIDEEKMCRTVLKSIENAESGFKQSYLDRPSDSIKLYVDKNTEGKSDIFMDVSLSRYPLRDYAGMWSEMMAIVKNYDKYGKRNKNATIHEKLAKHMMHLARVYLTGIDILEKGEINTYRTKEHDFLMKIRSGEYLNENMEPTKEFCEIVDELENSFDKAKSRTSLPDNVDMKKVNDFIEEVNEMVCCGAV